MAQEPILTRRTRLADWPAVRVGLVLGGRYGTLVGLAVLVAWFSFALPLYFPTPSNLINVLDQCALGFMAAGGLTVVLIAGEFDLSIGQHASLAGVLIARLLIIGVPIPVAALVVLACGALIGLAHGLIVTQLRVNAFITTLGMGTILVGVNYHVTGGFPLTVPSDQLGFLDVALGRFWG